MKRLPTAAALAILLLTAGVAGVVSAEPNGTDYRTTADAGLAGTTPTVADEATADDVAGGDATFEKRLAKRLQQFDLTDAQVREIVTEASRLEEAGASRLVIRSSIVMHLYEFGVDAPFLYAGPDAAAADAHRQLHRFVRSLDVTPEQARELHTMVHRMYDAGATREEIRQAVREKLAEWDVDRPDGQDDRPDAVDRLVGSLVDSYDLDREQAAEIERLIRGMLADGADRTEIHEAVSRLLDAYGIDHDRQTDASARDPATRPAHARVR